MSFDCGETKDGGFRSQSLMFLKKTHLCSVFSVCKKEAFHVIPALQAKAAKLVHLDEINEINHWS